MVIQLHAPNDVNRRYLELLRLFGRIGALGEDVLRHPQAEFVQVGDRCAGQHGACKGLIQEGGLYVA